MDTIFALSTPPGKSGVAVVRLSGPASLEAVAQLCGDVPEPRRASLRSLRDSTGEIIDEALVLTFEAGRSFTGEPAAELQVHGSPAVISRLLRVLGDEIGLRSAGPGEFTRRALENDRMDISQAEGLADLIDAETEMQRKLAQRVFSGAIRQKVDDWRTRLITAAALVEASLDFADEDVAEDVGDEVAGILGALRQELEQEITGSYAAERVRDGFEVAILGVPNSGKSTLLNRLAGREAAITSEIAGTTRDVIEVRMDISGLPVTFLDTAGLREAADQIEAIGVARARDRAAGADLRVFLKTGSEEFSEAREGDIVVQAKADLTGAKDGVSGLTGAGVDRLVARIAEILGARSALTVTATRERHRIALRDTVACMDRAMAELGSEGERLEVVGEELRRAASELSVLIGRVDVEQVLDEIFSRFCLGK